METILKILAVVGLAETLLLIVGFVAAAILWAKGISPALWRLGNGLAKRKIAIFAKGDNLGSIKHLLIDSKLFNGKNIYEITKIEDIGRSEHATMYLVVWHDWAEDIEEILRQKPDSCALI